MIRTRFFFDGIKNNRLANVYMKKPELLIEIEKETEINELFKEKLEIIDWENALIYLDNIIKNLYDSNYYAIVGKYNDLETIISLKNFMLTIGKNNFFIEATEIFNKLITFRNDFIFNLL